MSKVRIFTKDIEIKNIKLVSEKDLNDLTEESVNVGTPLEVNAGILAEVFYTPKGWRSEVHMLTPLFAWDFEEMCVLYGFSNDFPEGDLQDKNFDTMKASMQFLTRRLRKLGWEPDEEWRWREEN